MRASARGEGRFPTDRPHFGNGKTTEYPEGTRRDECLLAQIQPAQGLTRGFDD